jgi:flagellum-specific ATP synthase
MSESALAQFVRAAGRRIRHDCAAVAEGTLTRVVGMTLEATGLNCALGQRCLIRAPGVPPVQAEVVGFNGERVFLMPAARVTGLRPGLRVRPVAEAAESPGGDGLLGRVLDGSGEPIDGTARSGSVHYTALDGRPINPLHARRSARRSMSACARSTRC